MYKHLNQTNYENSVFKKKARKLADLKYANIRQWWGLALYEENICKEKLSDWWQSTHLDRKHNRNAWSALHPSGWPQYSLHGTTPHNYHIHCQNMKTQFLICFLFFQKIGELKNFSIISGKYASYHVF